MESLRISSCKDRALFEIVLRLIAVEVAYRVTIQALHIRFQSLKNKKENHNIIAITADGNGNVINPLYSMAHYVTTWDRPAVHFSYRFLETP
jgi:hypothetical protein